MTISKYPLRWPEGWPRTGSPKVAKFGKNEKAYRETHSWTQRHDLTLRDALKRVAYELGRLGVREDDCVVSTNLRVGLSGEPRADQGEPVDRGVAVYWQKPGKPMTVLAIDRYTRVRDNVAAIAATLEAMRSIDRHGGAQILERAFTGFTALPAPRSCWEILGFSGPQTDRGVVNVYFRRLAEQHHPDKPGGDQGRFAEISAARDEALKVIGGGT